MKHQNCNHPEPVSALSAESRIVVFKNYQHSASGFEECWFNHGKEQYCSTNLYEEWTSGCGLAYVIRKQRICCCK